MACNLYYSLLHVGLHEVTFLYDNLFRYLFVNWFLYFDNNGLWLLTITMLSIVDWLLY